jgi:hypothetical protein
MAIAAATENMKVVMRKARGREWGVGQSQLQGGHEGQGRSSLSPSQ